MNQTDKLDRMDIIMIKLAIDSLVMVYQDLIMQDKNMPVVKLWESMAADLMAVRQKIDSLKVDGELRNYEIVEIDGGRVLNEKSRI